MPKIFTEQCCGWWQCWHTVHPGRTCVHATSGSPTASPACCCLGAGQLQRALPPLVWTTIEGPSGDGADQVTTFYIGRRTSRICVTKRRRRSVDPFFVQCDTQSPGAAASIFAAGHHQRRQQLQQCWHSLRTARAEWRRALGHTTEGADESNHGSENSIKMLLLLDCWPQASQHPQPIFEGILPTTALQACCNHG